MTDLLLHCQISGEQSTFIIVKLRKVKKREDTEQLKTNKRGFFFLISKRGGEVRGSSLEKDSMLTLSIYTSSDRKLSSN